MDPKNRAIILKNCQYLCDNLIVDSIVPKLIEEGIIKHGSEFQEFLQCRTSNTKILYIIHKLVALNDAAFEKFKHILEDDFHFIVKHLNETSKVISNDDIEKYKSPVDKEQEYGLHSYLPSAPQPLLGREKDLEVIENYANHRNHNQQSSILILTGGPGFGKTSLALTAGHILKRAGFLVVFELLRGLISMDNIIISILQKFGDLTPCGNDSTKEKLVRLRTTVHKIKTPHVLFILDDIDDALTLQKEAFYSFLTELTTFQNLHCLCTSRCTVSNFSLNITHHEVKQLSKDSSLDLMVAYSVPGTLDRNSVSAQKIADLCKGCPLGLCVLTALYNRGLTEDDIEESLREDFISDLSPLLPSLPDSQHLHKCVEISFKRLSTEQKELFQQISVFPAGFCVDDVVAVTLRIPRETRKLLVALADSCLCSFDHKTGTYTLHPFIRYYSNFKLEESGKSVSTRKQFCKYFLDKIMHLKEEYFSPKTTHALEKFRESQGNFEQMLGYLLEQDELRCEVYDVLLLHLLFRATPDALVEFCKSVIQKERSVGVTKDIHKLMSVLWFREKEFGDNEIALKYIDEFNELYKHGNENDTVLESYKVDHADILTRCKDVNKAKTVLDTIQVPDVNENAMDKEEIYVIAKMHTRLASCNHNLRNREQAIDEARKAKCIMTDVLKISDCHPDQMQNDLNLAMCLIYASQHEESEQVASNVIKNCEMLSLRKSSYVAQALTSTAQCLYHRKQYSESEAKCKEALQVLEDIGHLNTRAHRNVLYTMARLCYFQNQFDQALLFLNDTIEIDEKRKCFHGKTDCLGWKGKVLVAQEKYQDAFTVYNNALALNKSKHHEQKIKEIYECMADVYDKLDDKENAKICIQKSKGIKKVKLDSVS